MRELDGVVSTESFLYLELWKQLYDWGARAQNGARVAGALVAVESNIERREDAPATPITVDVRLDAVTKRFDDVVAVDELSLEIDRGSFFALLGPSGCGKTTTLRMIGGFEEPTEGTIYLGEEPVTGRPPYKRDVNTVFQSYALFPHLTIFENVAFGLRRRGVRGQDVRGRVTEILRLVGLAGLDKRKPRQLSGGQQQRVALARALVNRPRVLLLDEPLGALDLKLRKQMQLELKAIQHDIGITFVHVTHDQEEAMTMADQIAIMRAGQIEQLGTPTELYERPRTAFVAGFLGISNLLPGTVTGPERRAARRRHRRSRARRGDRRPHGPRRRRRPPGEDPPRPRRGEPPHRPPARDRLRRASPPSTCSRRGAATSASTSRTASRARTSSRPQRSRGAPTPRSSSITRRRAE